MMVWKKFFKGYIDRHVWVFDVSIKKQTNKMIIRQPSWFYSVLNRHLWLNHHSTEPSVSGWMGKHTVYEKLSIGNKQTKWTCATDCSQTLAQMTKESFLRANESHILFHHMSGVNQPEHEGRHSLWLQL